METINNQRYHSLARDQNTWNVEKSTSELSIHSLLPLVLDCLNDDEKEHPTADQLCEMTVALKEGLSTLMLMIEDKEVAMSMSTIAKQIFRHYTFKETSLQQT